MTLTVPTVLALRASIRWRGAVDPSTPAAALITYSPADSAFNLCAYGRVMAQSPDPTPLAECLRQEAAQPGFIARVLSTAEPPDVAALDPAGRAEWEAARRAQSAAIRAHHAQEWPQRRLALMDPAKITLNDLLGEQDPI